MPEEESWLAFPIYTHSLQRLSVGVGALIPWLDENPNAIVNPGCGTGNAIE
jgi:hypothetical protein